MPKIKNIEALRFVFAVIIVYFHIVGSNLFNMYKEVQPLIDLRYLTADSWCIVELFFILSGLFLYLTLEKNINISVFKFALHKFCRLWPVFAFSVLCIFILNLFGMTKFNFYENFLYLLFCQANGITDKVVGINWYVSPLFWALIFYFALLKNFGRNISNFLIGIITFFGYVALVHLGFGRNVVYGFISLAMLRAFAGIGFGYLLGLFYQNIKGLNFCIKTKQSKIITFIIASVVEIYCFFFLVNNFVFYRMSYRNVMIFVFTGAMLFLAFIYNKGLLSKLFDNNVSVWLGKYAYSIYIMQQFCFILLKNSLWKNKNMICGGGGSLSAILTISLIFCIVVGIITYHLVEKPCGSFLKNLINTPNGKNL